MLKDSNNRLDGLSNGNGIEYNTDYIRIFHDSLEGRPDLTCARCNKKHWTLPGKGVFCSPCFRAMKDMAKKLLTDNNLTKDQVSRWAYRRRK